MDQKHLGRFAHCKARVLVRRVHVAVSRSDQMIELTIWCIIPESESWMAMANYFAFCFDPTPWEWTE